MEHPGRDAGLTVIGKKLLKDPDRHLCSVPVQLTRSVNRGLSSGQRVPPRPRVSDGGISPVSCPASCPGSTGGATGFSTEQSSVYSWRYDEFDQANGQRVRQLFGALDDLLYEGRASNATEALQKECEEWSARSPHLRISGKRLGPAKQEGVQYVHRQVGIVGVPLQPPRPARSKRLSGLRIDGHGLAPGLWSNQSLVSKLPLEEVYVEEGRIEEFLAYDGKETENEGAGKRAPSTSVWRAGVPPVSPGACLHDGVAGELFDDVWREVVVMLEEVLRKSWEEQRSDGVRQRTVPQSSSQTLCEPLSPLPSRGGAHVSSSGGSNSRNVFLWANSSNAQMNLNGVMTIWAKPLQHRQQWFSERCDSDNGNSAAVCARTQGLRAPSTASPRRRNPRLGLQTRPRLPTQSTQFLRGTRLSTVAEDLLNLPAAVLHNHRLPHIHAGAAEQDNTVVLPRHVQLRGKVARVGGAIHLGSSLPPLRDPTLPQEAVSRPNPTLTFRSDTPMKSSFTPMDFVCNMRTGRGLLLRTGHSTPRGVTGFNMGITCSTASGFSECATPPRRHTNLLPSTDGDRGNIPPSGSIGARKTATRFPIHGRKKCHVALP